MQAQTAGCETAVTAQGHIEQELVCQVCFHRQTGIVMKDDLLNDLACHAFSGFAFLAETGENAVNRAVLDNCPDSVAGLPCT
jgi:hypothetical protein